MEPLCTACGWRAPAGVCVCVWGGRGGQGGETGWRAPACHACTAWRTQHHPPYLPCCPPVCVLCCAGTTRRVCWTTLAPSSSLPPCRCCWCAPCPQKRQRRATCTSAPVRAALGGVGATAPRAAVCVCVCVCSRLGARRVHPPPHTHARSVLPCTHHDHQRSMDTAVTGRGGGPCGASGKCEGGGGGGGRGGREWRGVAAAARGGGRGGVRRGARGTLLALLLAGSRAACIRHIRHSLPSLHHEPNLLAIVVDPGGVRGVGGEREGGAAVAPSAPPPRARLPAPPPPPAPAPSHSPPLPRCSRSLEADARGGLRRLTPKLHVGVVHRELLLHNLPLLALRCRLDVLGLRGWGGSTRACV